MLEKSLYQKIQLRLAFKSYLFLTHCKKVFVFLYYPLPKLSLREVDVPQPSFMCTDSFCCSQVSNR